MPAKICWSGVSVGMCANTTAAAVPARPSAPRSNVHFSRGSPRVRRSSAIATSAAIGPTGPKTHASVSVGTEAAERLRPSNRSIRTMSSSTTAPTRRTSSVTESIWLMGPLSTRTVTRAARRRRDERRDVAPVRRLVVALVVVGLLHRGEQRDGRERRDRPGRGHADGAGVAVDGGDLLHRLERALGQREARPVAPAGLRVVERRVGRVQEALGVLGVLGEDRDAGAERAPHLLALVAPAEVLDLGAHAVDERLGLRAGPVGEQQAELLAAEAGGEAAVVGGASEAAGDAQDGLVAGEVAEAVVDRAQVVEVDHHERDRVLAPGRRAQRVVERLAEVLEVEERGLGVRARLVAQRGHEHRAGDEAERAARGSRTARGRRTTARRARRRWWRGRGRRARWRRGP